MLALSVSTTVRTPAGVAATGFPPVGMAGFIPPTAGALPLGTAPIGPVGFAGAAMAAGFAAPACAGLGGNEIRMVSFRRSAGGFATPGTGGGAPAAPGTEGDGSLGRAETAGMEGKLGLVGGGAKRIVSFFTPGTVGRAVAGPPTFGGVGIGIGGFGLGGATGIEALEADGGVGGPGGRGGGKGAPSAI